MKALRFLTVGPFLPRLTSKEESPIAMSDRYIIKQRVHLTVLAKTINECPGDYELHSVVKSDKGWFIVIFQPLRPL